MHHTFRATVDQLLTAFSILDVHTDGDGAGGPAPVSFSWDEDFIKIVLAQDGAPGLTCHWSRSDGRFVATALEAPARVVRSRKCKPQDFVVQVIHVALDDFSGRLEAQPQRGAARREPIHRA